MRKCFRLAVLGAVISACTTCAWAASWGSSGVAIGDNTYVRIGGTVVGSHNYRGDLGDITVNTDTYADKRKSGLGLYSTTLGSNSFTNGTLEDLLR